MKHQQKTFTRKLLDTLEILFGEKDNGAKPWVFWALHIMLLEITSFNKDLFFISVCLSRKVEAPTLHMFNFCEVRKRGKKVSFDMSLHWRIDPKWLIYWLLCWYEVVVNNLFNLKGVIILSTLLRCCLLNELIHAKHSNLCLSHSKSWKTQWRKKPQPSQGPCPKLKNIATKYCSTGCPWNSWSLKMIQYSVVNQLVACQFRNCRVKRITHHGGKELRAKILKPKSGFVRERWDKASRIRR